MRTNLVTSLFWGSSLQARSSSSLNTHFYNKSYRISVEIKKIDTALLSDKRMLEKRKINNIRKCFISFKITEILRALSLVDRFV